MKLIIGTRQTGKTMRLIRLAAKELAHIVVATHDQAYYVHELAKKTGHDIPFPLIYHEILDRVFNGGDNGVEIKSILIDDAQEFIREATKGLTVKGIAINLAQELEAD